MENKDLKELFERLFEEKKKWEMSAVIGKKFDFTNIRNIAQKLNAVAPKTFPFKLDGNDSDLMSSIIAVEKKYRP